MSKENKTSNKRYIPGLDGLRALAVVAVILYHLFPNTYIGGYIGVDIFFVISGFLITTLLIGERAESGRISLKKFWLRRARRLLPALFTTILIISSVIFFVRGDAMVGLSQQILGAATFSSNWMEVISGTNYFAANTSHLFMNFWSLAVEEQFYLIWPFVVLLLLAVVKKPKVGMVVTAVLALISASWMAYLYMGNASASRVYYGTDTHLFGLMIGAFLAFWVMSKSSVPRHIYQPFWFIRRHRIFSEVIGIMAFAGLGLLIFTLSDQAHFTYLGGLLLASILSAILLVVSVGNKGVLQKFFELAPLKWIGSRSYGIYLWHWPLIVIAYIILPTFTPVWLTASLVVITTFSIAAFSYKFIELPVRQQGFRTTFQKAIKKQLIQIDDATTRFHRRPHAVAVIGCLAVILTISAVITAPTKTLAQLRIEAGERAVAQQNEKTPSQTSLSVTPPPVATPEPTTTAPISGSNITAIGDSVMLASSPALQAKFPGILINAEVSRSMRQGGRDAIEQMKTSAQLREVVIVALGTNGYFGTGNLDAMINELADHKIILVTSHADREWTQANNNDVKAATQKYKNVVVADWDQAISPRPDLLSEDGIHPNSAEGDAIYTDCIATALQKLQ